MELRIKIPKTAVISEKCTLIEWNVEVGEKVDLGQPLYLIETEKTAIEIQSPVKGIIKSLAQIDETYDDRIFNCTYKDETMQVRKSEDICNAINNKNLDDYALVFKETYYEIHKIELITDLVKRSYGERVKPMNDETFVIDDRFMVDSKATAHYGTRSSNGHWKFLCIVVKGRPRKKAIKTKIGLVELDDKLLEILAKINFLLYPNVNDTVFTNQLPEWLTKTMIAEREVKE